MANPGLYVSISLCYIGNEEFRNPGFTPPSIMIGEKLGRYTILEIVGNGSMGTVYKAEDPEGEIVALKLVRSQVLYDMEKRERFLQCALVASEIRHGGICPILEIGDDNDDFFIIMPFIHGRTLEQYMERKSLPWVDALDIALAAGSALQALHAAGAVHRGFKPANIWILNTGDRKVMLSDCCVARFTEIARRGRTRTSALGVDFADTLIPLSALAYMSPEQVRGEPVDHRTDIFSFGVVLYEMLSGRHPFEARNSLSRISAILEAEPPMLTSKHSAIPVQLESITNRALAKNREARYQSISELLEQLRTIPEKASLQTARPEATAGIRKWFASVFGSRKK
jgi:serine/threonine protein kinase